MTHKYKVLGMTCGGCEGTIKDRLSSIKDITDVAVSKVDATAIITMNNHVSIETMQIALGGTDSRYQIFPINNNEAQTYQVLGMTCGGCEGTVKDRLSKVDHVTNVDVSKADSTATIKMNKHVSLDEMQTALGGKDSKYQISKIDNSEAQAYQILGMTCGGCEGTVKDRLSTIVHITNVEVSKAESKATITMDHHVSLETMQDALGGTSSKYQIAKIDTSGNVSATASQVKDVKPDSGPGTYYCPMHCEGDKTYDKFGSCPVCGMNLEKVPVAKTSVQWTCPMHPQIIEDEPGACPICGMDLVPLEPVDDDSAYQDMRKKLIIATSFALPVFIIAMADMIPNNPLASIFSMGTWN